MIDTSDLDRFAAQLSSTPAPFVEEGWQDEWSDKIAEEWRRNVPVLTGRYRDSIHTTSDGAASDVDYAPYVEYGTSDTAPQPALVPAINRLSRASANDAADRLVRDLIT